MRPAVPALALVLAAVAASGQTPEPIRLDLEQAVARALEASPGLARARADQRAAEAGLRGARAERGPSLELQAGYTRRSNVPEFATVLPDGTRSVLFPNLPNDTRARLGVSLPLYTGGRVASLVDAAESERDAAASDADAIAAEVVLQTRRAYWMLVTARESERVLTRALASFEAHLFDARNRERFGLAPRSEVLAVQVERERAELRRIEAGRDAAVAAAELQRLLGLALGQTLEPVEPLDAPALELPESESLVAQALTRRPEHAALEARIAAAEARVGVARSAGRPQLALGAGYDYANPNMRILPPRAEWQDTWDVGVTLRWNLFDAGRRAAAEERARAQAEAARQALEELQRRVRFEVATRLLDLETARAALAVAERAVEAAREGERVAGERHRAGVSPSSERLDAETGLLQAELERTRARATLRVAAAGLDRALGR